MKRMKPTILESDKWAMAVSQLTLEVNIFTHVLSEWYNIDLIIEIR